MFDFDRRFFGASEKMDGHFSKKLICLFFSNFKKSYLFNFDRRFFRASKKKDGHFSKKPFFIFRILKNRSLFYFDHRLPKKWTVIFRKNLFVYLFFEF